MNDYKLWIEIVGEPDCKRADFHFGIIWLYMSKEDGQIDILYGYFIYKLWESVHDVMNYDCIIIYNHF